MHCREPAVEPNSSANQTCVISQYTAAVKSSSLDPTAKALASLGALIEKDTKLTTILSAPTLSAEDKSAIVAELAKQSGAGKDATVKNFLNTLAENNRLSILGGVCQKFGQIMSAARGEVEMTVTSAQVCQWTDRRIVLEDMGKISPNNGR